MMAKAEDRQEERPTGRKDVLLSALLGAVALAGLSSAAATMVMPLLIGRGFVWGGPGAWRAALLLAVELLIGGAALWGCLRLRPRKDAGEPVSPATRKSNKLYWLKELLAGLAILALFFGAFSLERPFALFSNSPVRVWIALVAIVSWLLARVIRERWNSTSDEHARRASDFGRNAAAGVFLAVTPAWWVAARAGLLPQPDAMVLWMLTILVSTIGWAWRRSH